MKKHHASIGLINPKSPENVSSVKRAAGNYCVESIFYTGQRYPRALALNPDTPKMSRSVSINVSVEGSLDIVASAPENSKIICVEFAENATDLPSFQHPEKAYYIFGPEDGSITQNIIDKADEVIYIPTKGSMNLAATVNVVLYDRLSKKFVAENSNQNIIENRDRNNNLKVNK